MHAVAAHELVCDILCLQELVAEPTIFGEGILVGSKSVRLHAIDAQRTKISTRKIRVPRTVLTRRAGRGAMATARDRAARTAAFRLGAVENYCFHEPTFPCACSKSSPATAVERLARAVLPRVHWRPAGLCCTAGMSSTPNRRLGLQLQQGNVLRCRRLRMTMMPVAMRAFARGAAHSVRLGADVPRGHVYWPANSSPSCRAPLIAALVCSTRMKKLSAALTLDGSYDYRAGFDVTPSRGPVRWSGERCILTMISSPSRYKKVTFVARASVSIGSAIRSHCLARSARRGRCYCRCCYVSNYLPIRPLPAAAAEAPWQPALAPFRGPQRWKKRVWQKWTSTLCCRDVRWW